jgi:hypothetical protein
MATFFPERRSFGLDYISTDPVDRIRTVEKTCKRIKTNPYLAAEILTENATALSIDLGGIATQGFSMNFDYGEPDW